MNRFLLTLLAAACSLLQAQTAGPVVTEAKQAYTNIKNNLSRMAEKMPEEHYGFQPVPEIRTFGQLIAHVADSQTRNCSAVTGKTTQPDAASKTSKADLVAALKASFDACDAAFESLTDATAADMVKSARGARSKLGTLVGVTTHNNEEYGYLAVYLRLKGIVPPSSERR